MHLLYDLLCKARFFFKSSLFDPILLQIGKHVNLSQFFFCHTSTGIILNFGQAMIDSFHRCGIRSTLLGIGRPHLAQVTLTLNSQKLERVRRKRTAKME